MRDEIYHTEEMATANDKWTICDLFIRQWLNNMCDGFGMINVRKMYTYLRAWKDVLIEENMINEKGFNNSGFPLWVDYNF